MGLWLVTWGNLVLEVFSGTAWPFAYFLFWVCQTFCSVHGAKLIAFRTGLGEANRLSIHSYIIEGDFSCVICWASVCSAYPWRLTDAAEEVLELAVKLNASFVHVLCSANEAADSLAKVGVGLTILLVNMFHP